MKLRRRPLDPAWTLTATQECRQLLLRIHPASIAWRV